MSSIHACPDLSDMLAWGPGPGVASRWRQVIQARFTSQSQPAQLIPGACGACVVHWTRAAHLGLPQPSAFCVPVCTVQCSRLQCPPLAQSSRSGQRSLSHSHTHTHTDRGLLAWSCPVRPREPRHRVEV